MKTIIKKKIVASLLMVCFLLFPFAVSAAPNIVVDEPVFQFGSIPEGEHLAHTFILKNTGDETVRITQVMPP